MSSQALIFVGCVVAIALGVLVLVATFMDRREDQQIAKMLRANTAARKAGPVAVEGTAKATRVVTAPGAGIDCIFAYERCEVWTPNDKGGSWYDMGSLCWPPIPLFRVEDQTGSVLVQATYADVELDETKYPGKTHRVSDEFAEVFPMFGLPIGEGCLVNVYERVLAPNAHVSVYGTAMPASQIGPLDAAGIKPDELVIRASPGSPFIITGQSRNDFEINLRSWFGFEFVAGLVLALGGIVGMLWALFLRGPEPGIDSSTWKAAIVTAALLIVGAMFFGIQALVMPYVRMKQTRGDVDRRSAALDALLKQRHDALGNVLAAWGTPHEEDSGPLAQIVQLQPLTGGGPLSRDRVDAECRLSASVEQFCAAAGSRAELHTHPERASLLKALRALQRSITRSRDLYNASVFLSNQRLEGWPNRSYARRMGLVPHEFFGASAL